MSNNWLELGLSPDEENTVRRAAELYKAVYLDTIDNIFVIARALQILSDRHRNSGIMGGFADALVQYGFTARDGGPMNKAIRSHLKTLLENEQSVRAWWTKVPERTKRDWLSAKAIYTHWQSSQKPPPKPSPHPAATNAAPGHDALAQAKAELLKVRTENDRLREQLAAATKAAPASSAEKLASVHSRYGLHTRAVTNS